MQYDFICDNCPSIKAQDGKPVSCHHLIDYPMKSAPDFGFTRACPAEGCKGKVVRTIAENIGCIVRGTNTATWDPNGFAHANINGQETRFQFIDHPHTDPQAQAKMRRLAQRDGVTQKGIGSAYWNEKHGRYCVDVVSDKPDPFGAMARAEKGGNVEKQTIKVNQPVKRRGHRAK